MSYCCLPFSQQPIRDPLGEEDIASSSSVDSNNIRSYEYDVFISFRGSDTRNTFVDHLYSHLIRKGIFAFKDDNQLQKGKSISSQLLQAIKNSRVSIIVFSSDYASSTWCLDEMAAIAQCREKLKQTVFPVFYDVDPSDVRKQKGVYKNAFLLHGERFKRGSGRVVTWKRAMTSVAGVGGWDVRNKPQFQVIENIVETVIKALGHKFSGFADDLIGIQPHVIKLEGRLKLSSRNDYKFRVLGIWGMSGIGKTTLATALYDRISYHFGAYGFIDNVSKIYKDGGIVAVQKQILSQIMTEKNLDTYSRSEISGIVKNRLPKIKLLLVLDNVDQCVQLQELHIDPKLLCAGSRIIITTRDKNIFKEYGAVNVHEVPLMNGNDARELLHRKAFKNDDSSSSCAELIPKVLSYAQGHPLTVTVMGSFLCARNSAEWKATLNRLQSNPPSGVMEVLKIGVEGLELNEREIFLHVACFFKGEREEYVRRILDACELHPDIGIPLIAEKSLITIKNQEIHMHDMLQELGKQMVREDYPDEPRSWSKLWLYRDFHRVMMTETEARKVKAIVLDQKEDDFENELRAEGLSKMTQLRLLILCHKKFSGRPISLSNDLRYLSWNGYPFTFLPSQFKPYCLVELNMSDSSIEILYEGFMDLPNLRRMDLSNSKNLREIQSFRRMQNVERLDFTGCINLSEVHPSIGSLMKLVFLSLRNCCSLINLNFGSDLPNLPREHSLTVLLLSGCTKLEKTPNLKGALNLEYLDMDGCTRLSAIHKSLGICKRLRFLSLRDCTNLVELPDSIKSMSSLITLDLCGCLNFMRLPLGCTSSPSRMQSLISLDLSFCNIHDLPGAIGELRGLEKLNLQGNNFLELPSSIERLSSLAYLNLSHCSNLRCLPKLPSESAEEVGSYFKTFGSSDHRSGLYMFNCPRMPEYDRRWTHLIFDWIARLFHEPLHFRGGFDIVSPWDWEDYPRNWHWEDYPRNWHWENDPIIPPWLVRRFKGGSIIRRTILSDMHVDWVGFLFCVAFEVNSDAVYDSAHNSHSLPLPHPFYLSFESENTEERFDMPLSLELNRINGSASKYLWTIYISRQHCHFVETGAQITFKARQGLIIKECGLSLLTKEDMEHPMERFCGLIDEDTNRELWEKSENFHLLVNVKEGSMSNSSSGPKIQLPYNWFVSDENEVENNEAKRKEINLFNLGLE